MKVTARALNRTTMSRQLLLRRERLARAGGGTAGSSRSRRRSRPRRTSRCGTGWRDFDPADLDAAFADRKVVKATTMRITLHAVHADDYPQFHAAMTPALRASRLYDQRFTSTGLTAADVDTVLPELLAFAVATAHRRRAGAAAYRSARTSRAAGVVGAAHAGSAVACAGGRALDVRAPAGVHRLRHVVPRRESRPYNT